MVTLTNQTTSSASVTDVGVSGASQTNVTTNQQSSATVGRTTQSNSNGLSLGGDALGLARISLSQDFYFGKLFAFIPGGGHPSVALIYNDSNGEPGDLLHTSAELTSTAEVLREYTFTPALLTKGVYWIGIFVDGGFAVYGTITSTSHSLFLFTTYTGGVAPSSLSGSSWSWDSLWGADFYLKSAYPIESVSGDLPTAGYTTTSTASSVTTLDTIKGAYIPNFEGGELSRFYARLDPSGTITGNTIAGIYLNGELVAQSDPFVFSSMATTDYWQEFTFPKNVFIRPGTLLLVVYSDAAMHVERYNRGTATTRIVSKSVSYSGTLPSTLSVGGSTNYDPQIYITYEPQALTNTVQRQSTWNQLSTTWAGTTETWGDLVDYTKLTNL